MGAALSYPGKRLHAAIRKGQVEEVNRLLALDPTALQAPKPRSGRRPLHTAARHSQAACLAALLKAGAAVDARDAQENTALHAAAEAGSADCVKLLLAARANARAVNSALQTPVQLAYLKRNFEAGALLLQAAPPPEPRSPAAPTAQVPASAQRPKPARASYVPPVRTYRPSAPYSTSAYSGGFYGGYHGGHFDSSHCGGGSCGDGGCGGDGGGGGGD